MERNQIAPIKGVLLGLLIFVIGLILVWPLPALVLNTSEKATQQSLAMNQKALTNANNVLNGQAKWFMPSYMMLNNQSLNQLLAQANMLNGQSGTSCSNVWISKHLACLAQVKSQSDEAMKIINSVSDQLASNAKQKANAREGLNTFSTQVVSTQLHDAQNQFNQEASNHLLKYTDPLVGNLKDAANKLKTVGDHISLATSSMPSDSDQNQNGDPQKALDELNHAKSAIDEINALTGQVTSGIGNLKTARTQVQPTTSQASSAITLANQDLNSINSQYGWGFDLVLKSSVVSLNEAKSWLDQSTATQSNTVQPEGKYDWTLAYNQALSSLKAAQAAKSNADTQVATFNSAAQKLAGFDSHMASARSNVAYAMNAMSVLRKFHSQSAWINVAGTDSVADSMIQQAINNANAARQNLSNIDQKFAEANALLDQAYTSLDGANTRATTIVNMATSLEQYRSQWPILESSAQSTINSQSADISSYGGYDSGAQSDYNTAVSLLTQARSDASNRLFQPADAKAQQASSLASETGQRAADAYQAHVRAEEEAAREAAQAAKAAQQLEDESSHSSSSSSGGWESSSSSSSSSSMEDDGGGWSGGGGESSGGDDGGGW